MTYTKKKATAKAAPSVAKPKKVKYKNTSNRIVGLPDGSSLFPNQECTELEADMKLAISKGFVTKQ